MTDRHDGQPPELAVVLAVRDGAAEIAGQLDALAGQGAPFAWELVVVDDGSTDGTPAVVGAYRGRLPLQVVAGPQRGSAAARNVGVAVARASHLLFLDHDDEVAPGYLEAMHAALQQHSLVIARLDCRALNPGWIGEYRPPMQEHGPSMGLTPFGATAAMGVRRDLFDALGGFDETMTPAEDRDFCYRASRRGHPPTFVPRAVLRYRYRATGAGIFRQAKGGGVASARLYARYRTAGDRPRLVRVEIRKATLALWGLLRGRSVAERAGHLHRLGAIVGYVEGSIRTRVPYLRWRLPRG
jgi:GT2 family glycosyltransferase